MLLLLAATMASGVYGLDATVLALGLDTCIHVDVFALYQYQGALIRVALYLSRLQLFVASRLPETRLWDLTPRVWKQLLVLLPWRCCWCGRSSRGICSTGYPPATCFCHSKLPA